MEKQGQSQLIQKEASVTRGFLVIEVLLASSLLIIAVTAFVGAIIYSQESVSVAGGISRASFLAQEGIEGVRNIRDESFGNLSDGSHGLLVSNYQWILSGNSDTTDIYVRQINISTIDADRKLVTSTITWPQTAQRIGSIVLTTELSNWVK
jgi:Tfp pilus assembly protein PilV